MLHDIHKVCRIGTLDDNGRSIDVFVKIEFKAGKLSITGVEGPMRSGNARGSAGQIIMGYREYDARGYKSLSDITPAPGWGHSTIKALFDIWDKYHLNDMQAGCEHQRKEWDPSKKITIQPLHPTSKYWREADRAKDGIMTADEYAIWGDIVKVCESAWLHDKTRVFSPDLWTDETKAVINSGYLEIDVAKVEEKATGWVYPSEHPEGLLAKPCPVCGYKYGTAWLKMDIPASVHARLYRFPEADKKPAWV